MDQTSIQQQLLTAIDSGDSNQIRALIAQGADVNFRGNDPEGETPLIRAVTAGQAGIVELLIESGANVNCASRLNGATPLMFARGNTAIMRDLIAAGADVSARTATQELVSSISGKIIWRGGDTALHLAAAANNTDAAKVLIQAGADVEARAANGLAPLDYALKLGRPTEVAEALVEAGAQLTSQRLELMHSSAHEPLSDLWEFPWASESADNVGSSNAKADSESNPTGENAKSASTSADPPHCPACGTILYSRRTRICEKCGHPIPRELLLTDHQIRLQQEQREWARELADKFDPKHTTSLAARRVGSQNAPERESPSQLVRQISCASEFSQRDRSGFWLYFVGYTVMFFAITYLPIKVNLLPPASLLLFTAMFVFLCFRAWHLASPICPNCHHNIRVCAATFCHACGQPLRGGRCEGCGVLNSSAGFLPRFSSGGDSRWITYCPGCGVRLDAKMPRWRPGQRF